MSLILGDIMQVQPRYLPLPHLLEIDPSLLLLLKLLRCLLDLLLDRLDLVSLQLLDLRICSHLGLDKSSSLQLLLPLLVMLQCLILHAFLVGDLLDLVPNCLSLADLTLILDCGAECRLNWLFLG
jgi:hypothetical protein